VLVPFLLIAAAASAPPAPGPEQADIVITGERVNWSAEAVLNWSPEGPLRAVGGISRTHLKLRQFIDLSRLSGAIGRFGDVQDSVGLFAESNLNLAPGLTLTGGLRYRSRASAIRPMVSGTSRTIAARF
jgi:hypothetical protein